VLARDLLPLVRPLVRGVVAAGMLLTCRAARADPQTHLAWRTAACGVGAKGAVWEDTRFCNGLVADVLFFRKRNRDVGLGPYLEAGTAGFWDFRYGGGASLLVPIAEDFPLVLSAGIYDHAGRAGSVGGTVFWGLRSYNFANPYNWAVGLYASGYRDLDAARETLVSAGVEVDGFFLAAPFIFAVEALR
jgi:hypothetical protein